jgi:O-antigen/teichoic acid export membrane protein
MSIQREIVKGAAWMVAARWAVRGIGFVSTIILARLLVPADFGLVALATMLTGLIGVFSELGLVYWLIREADPRREHFDTAWTLQMIVNGSLAIVVVGLAPLIQGWFDKPALGPVMQCLALVLVLQGAANPGIAWFRKNMDFFRDSLTIVLPKIVAFGVTVTLALLLRSYWALVAGILAFNGTFFVLSYVLHSFRPRFDLSKVGEMWAFSFWSLSHSIFEYLADQIDTLIIGRFKTAREVGLYHVANDVAASPLVELSQPMSRVLMPAYVKIMDDRAELSRIFAKVFSGVALLALSIGTGVALIAHDAVAVILGAQWVECAPLMQVLAPAAAMFALAFPVYALLTALGRPRVAAYLTFVQVVLLVAAMLPAAAYYGLAEIALARLLVMMVVLAMVVVTFARVTRMSGRTIAASVWRPMVAAAVMALAVHAVQGWTADTLPVLRLVLSVAAGAAAFVVVLLLAWAAVGAPPTIERDLLGMARNILARTPKS